MNIELKSVLVVEDIALPEDKYPENTVVPKGTFGQLSIRTDGNKVEEEVAFCIGEFGLSKVFVQMTPELAEKIEY